MYYFLIHYFYFKTVQNNSLMDHFANVATQTSWNHREIFKVPILFRLNE